MRRVARGQSSVSQSLFPDPTVHRSGRRALLLALILAGGALSAGLYVGCNGAGGGNPPDSGTGINLPITLPGDPTDPSQPGGGPGGPSGPDPAIQRELASDGLPSATIPAFPGAEGFGSYAFGGRGDRATTQDPRIIRVTTLQDRVLSGGTYVAAPGSLREAVEASGPRIVVFNVSGTILLDTDLEIRHPYITIAGQSAPGAGVALGHHGLRVRTHDVVLRHLRLRIYFDEATDWNNGRFMDGLIIYRNDFEVNDPYLDSVYNVVLDHCSIAWGIDENVNTTNWVRTFTMQWCIISEGGVYGHDNGPEGLGWLTDVDPIGTDPGNLTKSTIHHNLFIHNSLRNPLITAGHTWDFRNNVAYNWTNSQPTQFRSSLRLNFVGNCYIAGLDASITQAVRFLINLADPLVDPARPSLFVQGNVGPLRTQLTQNEWDIGVTYYRYNSGSQCAQPPGTYCVFYVDQTGEKPLYELAAPASAPLVTTHDPFTARDLVLQNVGATRPVRDNVDTRLVDEVAYVVNTNPFGRTDPGYDPQTDPNLHHIGPHTGTLRDVLLFKPQNDPGYGCLPRVLLMDPGQTVDAAKLELLNRLYCTFPDGKQLPFDAAAVLADTTTYQWEVFQAIVPDAATIQSLYPTVASPALPQDTDGDGVPDGFEVQIGSNPGLNDSLQDRDGDGYLNIEEYLNSLAG